MAGPMTPFISDIGRVLEVKGGIFVGGDMTKWVLKSELVSCVLRPLIGRPEVV